MLTWRGGFGPGTETTSLLMLNAAVARMYFPSFLSTPRDVLCLSILCFETHVGFIMGFRAVDRAQWDLSHGRSIPAREVILNPELAHRVSLTNKCDELIPELNVPGMDVALLAFLSVCVETRDRYREGLSRRRVANSRQVGIMLDLVPGKPELTESRIASFERDREGIVVTITAVSDAWRATSIGGAHSRHE